MKSLLGALRAICRKFQATTGKNYLRTGCLYSRNEKLNTKWEDQENEKQERKPLRTAFDGKFVP